MVDQITRPRWLVTVLRWLGRRGLILLLCGTAWFAIGSIFTRDHVERFSRPGPGGPLQFLDNSPWPGVFWMCCGLMAIVVGATRRKFDGEDAYGWAAIVAPVLLWTMGYGWSYALFVYTRYFDRAPEHAAGRPNSGVGFIVYLMITLFLFIVARWPDPIDAEENVKRSPRRTRRAAAHIQARRRVPWSPQSPPFDGPDR
jgi:hypothetical protein